MSAKNSLKEKLQLTKMKLLHILFVKISLGSHFIVIFDCNRKLSNSDLNKINHVFSLHKNVWVKSEVGGALQNLRDPGSFCLGEASNLSSISISFINLIVQDGTIYVPGSRMKKRIIKG